MEIGWRTGPSVRELRHLAPLWGDPVCRSLPKVGEPASAKLAAKRAKTAGQSFPTRRPPRPLEPADAERSRWAKERDWNAHDICFNFRPVTCGALCYRADGPAGAYCCPVSRFSTLPKGSKARKHLRWRPNWCSGTISTARTPASVTGRTPAVQRSHLFLETLSGWRSHLLKVYFFLLYP